MDVRRVLREAGYTQKSFADRFGLHRNTVYHWARTKKMPKWAKIFLRAATAAHLDHNHDHPFRRPTWRAKKKPQK